MSGMSHRQRGYEHSEVFTMILPIIGGALSAAGSVIACYGVYVNNQQHKHQLAMKLWSISNPMLCAYSAGYLFGLWQDAIPMAILALMYAYYSVSNYDGIMRYKVKGEWK